MDDSNPADYVQPDGPERFNGGAKIVACKLCHVPMLLAVSDGID